MEPSRRLFFISLGAADFVTYDQREVFFPTPFCQENVIICIFTRGLNVKQVFSCYIVIILVFILDSFLA